MLLYQRQAIFFCNQWFVNATNESNVADIHQLGAVSGNSSCFTSHKRRRNGTALDEFLEIIVFSQCGVFSQPLLLRFPVVSSCPARPSLAGLEYIFAIQTNALRHLSINPLQLRLRAARNSHCVPPAPSASPLRTLMLPAAVISKTNTRPFQQKDNRPRRPVPVVSEINTGIGNMFFFQGACRLDAKQMESIAAIFNAFGQLQEIAIQQVFPADEVAKGQVPWLIHVLHSLKHCCSEFNCVLCGHSFGGMVANSLARHLSLCGLEPRCVVALDCRHNLMTWPHSERARKEPDPSASSAVHRNFTKLPPVCDTPGISCVVGSSWEFWNERLSPRWTAGNRWGSMWARQAVPLAGYKPLWLADRLPMGSHTTDSCMYKIYKKGCKAGAEKNTILLPKKQIHELVDVCSPRNENCSQRVLLGRLLPWTCQTCRIATELSLELHSPARTPWWYSMILDDTR